MANGIMKSVQRGTVTIAAGQTTGTATITSVNAAKALLITNWLNEPLNGNNASVTFAGITLTNGTTVTATRNTSDASNACTVNFSIIEFAASAIKSMQYGTISLTSAQTSNTATISSVNTGNASVFWLGSTSAYTSSDPSGCLTGVQLTNSTTVTALINTAVAAQTVYYVVCEFNSGILQSAAQQKTVTVTSGSTGTASITSVNAGNSILAYGGATCNSSVGIDNFYVTLTNGTTLTSTSGESSTLTRNSYCTVLEFPSGTFNSSVQRGSVQMANNTTSGTATISSVNTANSSINFTGWYDDETANARSVNFPTVALTNSTTVTISRGASFADVVTAGYEVAEWVIATLTQGNMLMVF